MDEVVGLSPPNLHQPPSRTAAEHQRSSTQVALAAAGQSGPPIGLSNLPSSVLSTKAVFGRTFLSQKRGHGFLRAPPRLLCSSARTTCSFFEWRDLGNTAMYQRGAFKTARRLPAVGWDRQPN